MDSMDDKIKEFTEPFVAISINSNVDMAKESFIVESNNSLLWHMMDIEGGISGKVELQCPG